MPLLVVDFLELRKLLGMAADQKYIAPRDLQKAKIKSPKSQKPTTFMLWVQRLVFKEDNELSPLEKQGVELFKRLRAYQDHRAGRRLEFLPVSDSPGKAVDLLDSLRMELDDQTDPSGAGGGSCELRSTSCGRPTGPIRPPSSTRPRTNSWAWFARLGPQRGLSLAPHDRAGSGL